MSGIDPYTKYIGYSLNNRYFNNRFLRKNMRRKFAKFIKNRHF